jgi:class 3 adenylate cyclase
VASLLVKQGPLAGQRVAVETQLVLGRLNADVTIDDPLISRRHALIRPVDGTIEIEDLGSLNGTWVNGERISGSRRLGPGDVVMVGSTSMEIELPAFDNQTVLARPAPPTAPTAPPPEPQPPAQEAPSIPIPDAAPPPPPPPAPAPPPPAPAQAEAPPRPRDQETPVGDELRPVTALFADIVGSTGLGERLAPDEVKVVVGECVSRMTHAVEQFGGTVQSYMGDGIAAFFGIPSAHEDDPERAARAALRILGVVGEYAQEVEAAWGISDFNARVGINTGETAVGLVGSSEPAVQALGDTTNVAARLQSAAAPGTIAVGEAHAKCVVHRFLLEPLGAVSVKGRVKPVEAWRLVSVQTEAQPAPKSPLVGRESEVARLQDVLADLRAGRGQLLFIMGDVGLGKTRLLAELRSLAAGTVTWLEGQCLSYGAELLYGPFIEMLRGWVGAEEGEAELSVRTKLRAKLGLLPASQLPDVVPYLTRLLSLRLDPDDDERIRALGPEALAAEIRRAYRAWILSLTRQGPVVVAIEDINWADRSTRELAEDLLELADLAPLLFVATSRVDPSSEGWKFRVRVQTEYVHRTSDIAIERLSDEAAGQLLALLPRSESLKEAELEQIVGGAEGNPLYLEELLNAFAEGSGVRRGQTWAPTVTGARILTPTLESLLVARIDRLPPGSRRLAQVAAVIGRRFPLPVLEHLIANDDLEADLSALLRADIIREVRHYPEPEYTFRHGLLREASLSTLPPARRRELHGAVAAAFETQFAAAIDDHLEVLAHYYARSEDLAKALDYLERAGEKAAALDAAPHAAELWRRALKVAVKLGDREAEERVRVRLARVGTAEEDASP